jgi:hypothetical protein
VLLRLLLFLREYGLAQLLWRLEVGHALIGDLDRLLKNNVQVAKYDGLEAFDDVVSGTDSKAVRRENARGFWVLAPNHDGHEMNSAVQILCVVFVRLSIQDLLILAVDIETEVIRRGGNRKVQTLAVNLQLLKRLRALLKLAHRIIQLDAKHLPLQGLECGTDRLLSCHKSQVQKCVKRDIDRFLYGFQHNCEVLFFFEC